MSLALHTQAVIQGAFILAEATGGADVAADGVDHLRRYVETLFAGRIEPNMPPNPEERTMRKITIIEHSSLDGVIEAPGSPGEEPDYPYGGWAVPHHNAAVGEAIVETHGSCFDLLLGRRTYDIFASYWPHRSDPMAVSLNTATKYVATHRVDSLNWGPVKVLDQDIVAGVEDIKSTNGPDLIVYGSSTVTPVLLEQGMADTLLLFVFPVVLGVGKRFFSDHADPRELALVSSKAAASGVLMNSYRYVGPLRTGSFDDPPA